MSKRYRIGKYYVERDKKGRFMNWTSVGKSLAADRRTTAKKVKQGYGHRGDLKDKKSRLTMFSGKWGYASSDKKDLFDEFDFEL